MSKSSESVTPLASDSQFVTVRIGGQLFGLPISSVNEVFAPERITRVPLAPHEIQGVLNLRGRIVTMIDLRRLLGLADREATRAMAVGIEYRNESYGLMIDEVGEVLSLEMSQREPAPANIDPRWAELVTGVFRIGGELMLILDLERSLGRVSENLAA